MEVKKVFTFAYFLAFLAIASSSCRQDHEKLSAPVPQVAPGPRAHHHKFSAPVPVAPAPRAHHHKLSSPVPVAPAPSPHASMAAVCSDIVLQMTDCVDYLIGGGGSPITRPGSKCCKGAKTVVEFNGKCVCVAIETSSELGIKFNMTRVQALPSLCGIDYSLENCGILSGSSPSPSPVEAPHLSPKPAKAPTPYAVEAPAMTPGPVEALAMTPDPAEAPAMSTDPSQAPAMTPDAVKEPTYQETCYDIMYNMMECMPYLVKGSTWKQPEDRCCEGYKFTLDFDGKCICETLKSSGDLGIKLNMTRAEGLPSMCGIKNGYPLQKCGINLHPKSSPSGTKNGATQSSGSTSLMSSSFTATVFSSIAISMVLLLSY